MDISFVAGLGSSLPLFLVALRVRPEGESVTDSILSVTLFYKYISLPMHTASYIYISGHFTACLYVFALPTRWNCHSLDEVFSLHPPYAASIQPNIIWIWPVSS
jgi:hypothetical protein